MRKLVRAAFVLALACPAQAADITVHVATPAGVPIANAVVAIQPEKGKGEPVEFEWPLQIGQRELAFDPFVLVVPVGAKVAFPNFDTVGHHVYSFSPARRFEIELYGKNETRSVAFPVKGIVAIGCNIHDNMSAFVYVTDTRYAAKTDAAGKAVIKGVPEGAASAEIWHPHATAQDGRTIQRLNIVSQTNEVKVELDLRTRRRKSQGHY
jgi:plastocyanin